MTAGELERHEAMTDAVSNRPPGADEQKRTASATTSGSEERRDRAGFAERIGETGALDPVAMRAWRAFLQAHALVVRELEAELQGGYELPLAEYDVLVQLALADDRMLRMRDLADRVVLSRGGITRLVDRLVADGLVRRQKCGDDARGAWAVLTEEGLDRVRTASPCHLGAVRRLFADAFDESELADLAALLERVPATGNRERDGS